MAAALAVCQWGRPAPRLLARPLQSVRLFLPGTVMGVPGSLAQPQTAVRCASHGPSTSVKKGGNRSLTRQSRRSSRRGRDAKRGAAADDGVLGGDSTGLTVDSEHDTLMGAYWSKERQVWFSRVKLDGEWVDLGTYETPEQAHDAYVYACEWHALDTSPDKDVPEKPVKKYIGVWYLTRSETFEAVVEHNGTEISGGEYATALEAAQAHDALARMYGGEAAATNFPPQDDYAAWVPPTTREKGSLAVPTLPGQPLTLDDVTSILQAEGGLQLAVYPTAGVHEHFEAMGVTHVLFVNGRTVGHMRRMGDHIVKALSRRGLRPGPDMHPHWAVEGREQEHWMAVDTGSLLVNIFEPRHREAMEIDAFYEDAAAGKPAPEVADFDQWVDDNPVPQAYLDLLEADEVEIERKYALKKLQQKAKKAKKAAQRARGRGAAGV